jgi:hypothetical protein
MNEANQTLVGVIFLQFGVIAALLWAVMHLTVLAAKLTDRAVRAKASLRYSEEGSCEDGSEKKQPDQPDRHR